MWGKIGQLFITYLLLPLAEKGIAALLVWFKLNQKAEKYAKKAKEKTEAYRDAKNRADADNAFINLL